jgi:hypothetical protein
MDQPVDDFAIIPFNLSSSLLKEDRFFGGNGNTVAEVRFHNNFQSQ